MYINIANKENQFFSLRRKCLEDSEDLISRLFLLPAFNSIPFVNKTQHRMMSSIALQHTPSSIVTTLIFFPCL